MESFGIEICDNNITSKPGTQHARTLDGYVIPFNVHSGLVYMPMQPPTDQELADLPHVNFTSDNPWDPSKHDCAGTSPPQNGTPISYAEDVPEDSSDENTSLAAYTNEVAVSYTHLTLPTIA